MHPAGAPAGSFSHAQLWAFALPRSAASRKRPHSPLTSRIGFAHNSSSSFPTKQTRNRQQQKIKNIPDQQQQYGQAYAAWPGLCASYVFFFLHAAVWPGLAPVPHEVTPQYGQAYAHRMFCVLYAAAWPGRTSKYGQAYAHRMFLHFMPDPLGQ